MPSLYQELFPVDATREKKEKLLSSGSNTWPKRAHALFLRASPPWTQYANHQGNARVLSLASLPGQNKSGNQIAAREFDVMTLHLLP